MPTISSRTPEGSPNTCPICGADVRLEPSLPSGDAPCSRCGSLLWFAVVNDQPLLFEAREAFRVRDALETHLAEHFGIERSKISESTSFAESLGADSLETVELVMLLEEEFDLSLPDVEAAKIQTVAKAIALILRHRRDTK